MNNRIYKSYRTRLAEIYRLVKSEVETRGYCEEITWQESQLFENMSESNLLRESAWVILCGGFKESVIRSKFGYISLCFCDWQSSQEILAHKDLCRETALKSFGHKGKINAIINVAKLINDRGFATLKNDIQKSPIETLKTFPYIGDVTAWHLAKNLGIPVAKPDRHLVRLARILGYHDVQRFCGDVSELSGDEINVVDMVLWRYATFDSNFKMVLNVKQQPITKKARIVTTNIESMHA